jgi:polyphosphate kinase 2 (PPK2 family)
MAKGKKKAATAPESPKLKNKDYLEQLRKLHVELVKLQEWVIAKGVKVCIVFEGRDGAGKGGTIKALTERVSPRVFRVVALPAPTDREKSQMHVQRYLPYLPAAGEVVIFDRSWYNRAGVELEVSPEEQTRRLEARINDGRKTWKLTPMDLKSYSRWYDYSRARDEMFKHSDTEHAPWLVADSNDKRRARLNIITDVLSRIPYEDVKREKVELPKRQKPGKYRDPDYPYKRVAEKF